MTGPGRNSGGRRLDEEAAEWFARMRGPDARAQRDAFKAWLNVPANRSAYNSMAESFSLGRLMIDGRARRRRLVTAGAAMLLMIGAGTWLGLRSVPMIESGPGRLGQDGSRIATGTALLATAAERRAIRLRDGSMLILAAGTTIDAQFSGTVRRLTLGRGQARFQVAHERRPFIVYAGGGSVTARGTIFEVGVAADKRVSVRLIQGAIDVAVPSLHGAKGMSRPRRLRAGESMSYAAADAALERPTDPPPDAASAAPLLEQEAKDYSGISVAELVAEANRGSGRPIRLADPAIGKRQVSGRFRINDTALLAERIAALFDLVADRTDTRSIVLRPR